MMLVIFHPIQIIAHKLSGDSARKKIVDILNIFLVKGFYIMGCPVSFSGFDKIPQDRPIIIVSNHQSMFDIPAIVNGFSKFYPRFIAKIELGKGLPSISYNLKHGHSALIDRSKGAQSVKEIFKVGRLTQQRKEAICIFPEGTRSKTGRVKSFKTAGIETLLRAAPDAVIVPFAIKGHSQFNNEGSFNLNFGTHISYTVLDAVEPKGHNIEELTESIRQSIKNTLES